ncbi:hypothetical protein JX265_004532 [Neoarthrinium moseri]|uniref:BZIP transcription factor n=1 Tax=Neoarthrinium moseri TaxID=1658444 RepID=A0A9Q0ASI2_9PEZI|nr:uncharacterized protein JN550_008148 [Neoarthrinium moseri]KAI1840612.1 hypothetical protein JX266_013164 [Neoarthrinium moseri]KAI1865890.1 hypothetical protein JN550_008148 [Neoarthrinium moseri]KAI1875474.1 hypothetical protein JX265_004532 [Neoarthrinium moseri]
MTRSTSDSSKSSKRKGEYPHVGSTVRPPTLTGSFPGTRSVSTLTPAQLARKRANDREAQRAIRARTKEHIENLERELEELRSTQNRDETVQDLLRKNRALEEELHRLRENMGIAAGGPRGFYPPSYQSPTPRHTAPGPASDYPGVDMNAYDSMHNSSDGWPSVVPGTIPSTVSSPSSSGATDDIGSTYFPTSAPSILDRPGLSSAMNSPTVSCISGKTGFDDIKPEVRHRVPATQHPLSSSSLPATSAMEHVPHVLPGVSNSMNNFGGAAYWETPGLITPPLDHSETLLAGYIHDCRRLVTMAGVSPHPEVIFGPACPNIRRLIETHWNLASIVQQTPLPASPPPHPLVELASTIFDNENLAMTLERLGTFVLFQRILAWLIQPTQDTYNALGDYFIPRPSQRTTPHSQWVDLLLWGQLRDSVIQRQEVYANAEFRQLYATSLRVLNWSGGPSQALVPDHSSGSIYLTNSFINHVLNIGNWALEERFFRRYPELSGMVPMVRQGF